MCVDSRRLCTVGLTDASLGLTDAPPVLVLHVARDPSSPQEVAVAHVCEPLQPRVLVPMASSTLCGSVPAGACSLSGAFPERRVPERRVP